MAIFLTLTYKGRVKRWYHTLPIASIDSFKQVVKDLHKLFNTYDYRDVLKRINQMRMKLNELIKDFSN